jgi:hypothetical protein
VTARLDERLDRYSHSIDASRFLLALKSRRLFVHITRLYIAGRWQACNDGGKTKKDQPACQER